jgi:hypothetical protein
LIYRKDFNRTSNIFIFSTALENIIMASDIEEDWSNFILAVWLFISPWALQYAPSAGGAVVFRVAAWNAWISAVAVGVMAVMAVSRLQQWEEWVSAR